MRCKLTFKTFLLNKTPLLVHAETNDDEESVIVNGI